MRFASLLLVPLLLAAAGAVQADPARARLQVSAQVVVSCRLDASVPRAATPRTSGAASFSVACTRGANATAMECASGCIAAHTAKARAEYQLAEPRGEGATIATLLF